MMHRQRLAYCAVLLLLKITYCHVSAKQNRLVSEQWALEDMPFLSIIFAKSAYLPTGPCKEDAQRFLHDLLKGSAWAMQSKFMQKSIYSELIHTRRKYCR